jgi:hypothetical protein
MKGIIWPRRRILEVVYAVAFTLRASPHRFSSLGPDQARRCTLWTQSQHRHLYWRTGEL